METIILFGFLVIIISIFFIQYFKFKTTITIKEKEIELKELERTCEHKWKIIDVNKYVNTLNPVEEHSVVNTIQCEKCGNVIYKTHKSESFIEKIRKI